MDDLYIQIVIGVTIFLYGIGSYLAGYRQGQRDAIEIIKDNK